MCLLSAPSVIHCTGSKYFKIGYSFSNTLTQQSLNSFDDFMNNIPEQTMLWNRWLELWNWSSCSVSVFKHLYDPVYGMAVTSQAYERPEKFVQGAVLKPFPLLLHHLTFSFHLGKYHYNGWEVLFLVFQHFVG